MTSHDCRDSPHDEFVTEITCTKMEWPKPTTWQEAMFDALCNTPQMQDILKSGNGPYVRGGLGDLLKR